MSTLLFWAGGRPSLARARAAEGAQILLWSARGESGLREADVPFLRPAELLQEGDRDAIDEAAIAWTKAWGKRPLEGGASFRERLRWKGVSLWWFAELYLHHSTRSPALVRTVETMFRVLERIAPGEVEAVGLPADEAVLLARVCSVQRILFHGGAARTRAAGALRTLIVSLRSRWNTAKAVLGAAKTRVAAPPPPPRDGAATVLFLSHAAFWRERTDGGSGAQPRSGVSPRGPSAGIHSRREPPYGEGEPQAFEHYFDRLIPGVAGDPALQPLVVAVGPRAPFRRRGAAQRWREWLAPAALREPFVHVNRYTSAAVLRETRAATRLMRAEWRRLRRLPAMQQAFAHRGVGFADLAEADLAGTLLLQLPWAVLAYEQTREALRRHRPRVLCLYAESSGWGRAALAACAAEGVRSVAVQHGILYPKYFSYRHDPDEADCPRPDRTAVFGAAAQRFLVEKGGYEPGSLVLTGSPKFDELLERAGSWDRCGLRRRLGVADDESLLVVASRFRPIRDTHHAIGGALPALLLAVEAMEGVRCVIKPHPAEPAEPYTAAVAAAGATRTRVLPAATDLLQLMHAGDALVTVESLSAVEALVLGRPVVVLEMPNHLRDLVDAGVALGVPAGRDPSGALWAALRDPDAREQLEQARQGYLSELAMGVDGRATERILALVREMAADAAAAAGVVGS